MRILILTLWHNPLKNTILEDWSTHQLCHGGPAHDPLVHPIQLLWHIEPADIDTVPRVLTFGVLFLPCIKFC